MILQPCNVELTKIHYYDATKRVPLPSQEPRRNLEIATISREMSQNNFNGNVIIKRNIFGHRWVLKINDAEDCSKKRRSKLRVVAYVFVFCSIVVAVCFGIFFSLYKNRSKTSDHKTVHLKPISIATVEDDSFVKKTHENQVTVETIETSTSSATIPTVELVEETIENEYKIEPSTAVSICGPCTPNQEVCLKIQETDTPKCVKITDRHDPTGCGGLCPINTHFCQVLDARDRVYQCSPLKKGLVCPNDSFNCGNMCVSGEKRCDGLVHCSNGSDEENCVCNLETHFQCGNFTSCLEKKKKCDRKVDCWDRSDEMDCTKMTSCGKEQIPCTDGQCVQKESICDGKFDCADRTDEPEGCQM